MLACRIQRYGRLGRHPRSQTIFFGIVQFKEHHRRYPKTPLLACRVWRYGCLGRHARTQTILFGIVQFKHHTITGTEKHLCWPVGYRCMGDRAATPEHKEYLLALCSSSTTIIGIQKPLCWLVGHGGMGVWGATREHKQFFWHCAV